MNQTDSIRQAVKLRKYLFIDLWPNHSMEDNSHAQMDETSEED